MIEVVLLWLLIAGVMTVIGLLFGGVAVAAKSQPDLIETDYRFHRSNHDCRATNPVSIMP